MAEGLTHQQLEWFKQADETQLTYLRILGVVVEVFDDPESPKTADDFLDPGTHFINDYGYDSLDLVELSEALNQEFDFAPEDYDDEDLNAVATMSDVFDLVVATALQKMDV